MKTNQIVVGECSALMDKMQQDSVDLVVTSPPYDCYAEGTEVLTYDGWKSIEDVNIGEMVLSLNPHTKEVYWENVVNTFKYKYTGKMISFKSFNVDILVTPNHKMYVEYRDGSPTRERLPFVTKSKLKSSFFKEAKDITSGDLLRINEFIWNGKRTKEYTLPSVKCIYNKQNREFDSIKIDMDTWCEFLGIYLAEGSARGTKGGRKGYDISIKQKKGKSCDYINGIFERMPFKYVIHKDSDDKVRFSITDVVLHTYLKQFGNSHEKYIPKYIKELSVEYLTLFMNAYLIGDGTKSFIKRGNLGKFSGVRSVSRKMKEDMLEIAIKLGLCAREGNNDFITFHNRKYTKIGCHKTEVDYNGYVSCLEVKSNNIIFVKRNGKCIFSGNSLRDYKGYNFDCAKIAKSLFRVMKPGGVVVWVVGDATIKGSETGTSFRHALTFMDAGFRLHDTMIYEKNTSSFPARRTGNRYTQIFDYMFVFSKGAPKTANLICDKPNKWAGHTNWGKKTDRQKDGSLKEKKDFKPVPEFSPRNNIWRFVVGGGFGQSDKLAYEHPATFPEELVKDHVLTWTQEGDVVLDPLCGSGTTCKVAKELKRKYIGMDISEEYCELSKKRVK